jgi:CDP-diacylglycerol--glycerol-3-phosphate 3-phosphatidyltransferase
LRITANQVTLLRLLLLPLPVAMIYKAVLYGGGLAWAAAGLGMFILLGLTDAVDGMLARRHGSTTLGALLDPIVDKIFLVATFGPLADLTIVSPALVGVLFVRELAVTALRSTALERKISFRTSRIAKLKTTVQGAGSGFIFLFYFLQDLTILNRVMWVTAIGAAIPVILLLFLGRRPGWRSLSAFILLEAAVVLHLVTGPARVISIIMWVIIGFTIYSGAEYFWGLRRVLGESFRQLPLEPIRQIVLALAVPVCVLPVMMRPGAPIYAILMILAAELALGGVENSLAQAGRRSSVGADLLRSGIQIAGGGAMWILLNGHGSGGPWDVLPAHAVGVLVLMITLLAIVRRVKGNRQLFTAGFNG